MILGFDFGMKYIGIATGNLVTKTATALTSIRATDGIPNWQEIADLIAHWQPSALVIGIPLNMDGSEQLLTKCAQKFANRMRQKFKLPIHLVDERLSTWEAKNQLLSRATKLREKDLLAINARAAAIIVEQWLLQQ
ncbi:MAG TPA: Holliday junction resolvase RuvX [Gammaproteobacteria bacterium]|nr:Holliday junction resolvase RuvX [Gammaproteobacteria bacterium]